MSPEDVHLEERAEEEKPVTVPVLPAARETARSQSTAAAPNVIVAIFVVLAACYFAKIVFVVLLVSALLAFILAPLVDLLERVHVPRPLGALFAVCLLGAALYGVGAYGYSKAADFVSDFPKYKEKIQGTIARIQEQAEHIQRTAADVMPQRQQPQPQPPPRPEQQGRAGRRGQPQPQPQQLPPVQTVRVEQSSNWFDTLTAGAGSVTEVILAIGFIPFLVYFMLSWQEHVRANTVMLFDMRNRNTAYVTLGAISRMIRSFVVGNVLIGLFMSGVAMIVFGAVLHLPYFYFIAFISGFLSLIPYLGVVLAILPPTIAGLGQMRTSDFVIIVVTVVALHIFAMNVLYPKFVGSRVALNPLAVTLALLIWGWLWGAMGLILAVPITAAMKIIFDHVETMRPYGTWLGE